jgi:hypothetical protein
METYIQRLEIFKDAPCDKRMWVIFQEARTPLSTISTTVVVERLERAA